MANNLVIVESPAKAKTIEKFLGPDYKVMSSYGHIRDLKKKDFEGEGIDSPEYVISKDKEDLVRQLRKAASEAKTIWLASDEDREGEAIAWHLAVVLGLDIAKTRRIVFHEITKNAILEAIAHPRTIDLNRVDAQQARRVLDRVVGFELSPVLWRKIKPALSAGRVQSVAVRLIVEREQQIKEFVPERYFRVTGHFETSWLASFRAELSRRFTTDDETKAFLRQCSGSKFSVETLNVRPVSKSPAPPFTTSTLQQVASAKLGMTVSQTMIVAQRLYEAGHITYMRTDSLNLSSLAIEAIKKEILSVDGPEYVKIRNYHTTSKGAQEAHEAIRPTYIDKVSIEGTIQEQRLYKLIRNRTIASQMADARIEKTTAEITADGLADKFVAQGEVVKFDGFLKVYSDAGDEDAEKTIMLPALKEGESLTMDSCNAYESYSRGPLRYTEATLVKKMEELGIGRPSTYAPTISTIQQREYVEKGDRPGEVRTLKEYSIDPQGKIVETTRQETFGSEKGKLIPTDTGIIVNDFLIKNFPDILDYNFTAQVEAQFDEIAEGKKSWKKEIRNFYDVFHPHVEKAGEMKMEHKPGERMLGTDPATGKPVSVKIGRFGPVAQMGDSNAEEKPHFAPLRKDQSVLDITLEEALKLFELPKTLGEFEGKTVTVAIGRFGPYVRHDGKFVSIPKNIEPRSLTLEEACDLIVAKRADEANKTVKTFDEDPKTQILNGRYGVYIKSDGKNYKIPKSVTDPASLTLEQVKEIISSETSTTPRRKSTATRKSSSRK